METLRITAEMMSDNPIIHFRNEDALGVASLKDVGIVVTRVDEF